MFSLLRWWSWYNGGGKPGCERIGARSIALGISLPFEQGVNQYADPELSFEFHYFFIRKFYFLYHAKAVFCVPGGFGTMDELFETLTLIQTNKLKKNADLSVWERVLGRSN